jgi:hypothetical protein
MGCVNFGRRMIMEYKDKCFCVFYETCKLGNTCHRALTQEVINGAFNVGMWVSQFVDKPDCYKDI